MQEKYFPQEIEPRQQARWAAAKTFEVEADLKEVGAKPKFYCLEMLPYPSGRIHMGHVRNYSIGDALSHFKRMQGFNVLHPMGWDAFGMPAENAAIKNNARPDQWTIANIDAMRAQLQQLGFSYDWSREIASCTPEYYRWNQWFFIQMFKRGLVYRKNATVNWCDKCNTSLANEQAEGGFCWRHEDVPVRQRQLEQWFVRVTNYANELLDDVFKPFLAGGVCRDLVHVVAVNSGKLMEWIDWKEENNNGTPLLLEQIRAALQGEQDALNERHVLIDLNNRSLVGAVDQGRSKPAQMRHERLERLGVSEAVGLSRPQNKRLCAELEFGADRFPARR